MPFGKKLSISISVAESLSCHSTVRFALEDFINLLRKGFPRAGVALTASGSTVRIVLAESASPTAPSPFATEEGPDILLPCPDPSYEWESRRSDGVIELTLRAGSPLGAACGLYGLLQEKLGFRFIHPRQTLVPGHDNWPLPHCFTWSAAPRFAKRGFHLHTLHPTELSEQLNNPAWPDALADIREYIDWLARNGQNVMQFYLLRGALTDIWTEHAAEFVGYAHERGIMVGIAFSFSMLQQRACQAVNLLRPFPSYRRRIDAFLSRLFRVDWDYVTVDFTMGEYLPDLGNILPRTSEYLIREVTARYRKPLFRATHVIRRKHDSSKRREPGTGILIHTVMNYALTDFEAPVYGNTDLGFMHDRALVERKRRETWFWPESSYWIAYDTPIPLLLLSYLDARWRDMKSMEEAGLPGHITFSSGWEWGYWLIDWSIARWSWRAGESGEVHGRSVLGPLEDLFPGKRIPDLWREALNLEMLYLKDRGLIRWMSAATPFSELPSPFAANFQPAPRPSPARLLGGATLEEKSALRRALADLEEYARLVENLVLRLDGDLDREPCKPSGRTKAEPREIAELRRELRNCLAVSGFRARHRSLTLRAMLALIADGGSKKESATGMERLLAEAASARMQALELVREQESFYRYPSHNLAGRRESMTAYRFGYLYPVRTLFFWEREEEQVRHRRFDPFFMNLWEFRRVLGLESLLL